MTLSNTHPQVPDVLPNPPSDPILRLPEVERQTGLKKTYIYALVKKGEFPTPIKLGERASGWLSSEVCQWVQDRVAISRAGGK
jgi:prophage regulatory protein